MRKLIFLGVMGAMLVSGASAQVGKWTGRVDMKMPDMSKIKDPKQKKQVEQLMATMKQFLISMEIKADKTVTMRTPAMKLPNGMNRPASTATGVWKASGNTITLTINKTDGKPVPAASVKDQSGTLSADKKTITVVPPEGQGGVKIIFKKN